MTRQDILPPTVRPFTISARYDGKTVSLEGFVGSEQVRRDLLKVLSQLFPAANIADQMRVAEGAPREALNHVTFALNQLARMTSVLRGFQTIRLHLKVIRRIVRPMSRQ